MLTYRSCQVLKCLVEPTVQSAVVIRCSRAGRAGPARSVSTAALRNWRGLRELTTPTSATSTNQRRLISHEGGSNNQLSQNALPSRSAHQGPGRLMFQREMRRSESQFFGTIHGGIIMQLLEEGGATFANQYCQSHESGVPNTITTMTASLEKAEFLRPMFVGEVAEVYAELGYTSPHSMQVTVSVMAYNEDSDERRLVNRGKLWYVPRRRGEGTVLPVPENRQLSEEQQLRGRQTYERMKAARQALLEDGSKRVGLSDCLAQHDVGEEWFTVNKSRTQMIKPVKPSYCWPGETYCRGGISLKMIDDLGCISAVQFCKSYCVTVSNDSTIFLKPVDLGSLLVANARIIFTSSRSLEVKVDVDELKVIPGVGMKRDRAVESILTCLTLDENLMAQPMPQLKIKNDEEQKLFDERKRLYDERKREKAAAKKSES